ncbi:methylmalonyl-CoA mutase subunit beta [Pseudofulvibacter geojedonensis]|uniref:Methylmalonyl-CoA mutase subunit beta n=1 Tax=Pseudofulvibacter geojedonensis TaxID=1123758 RepID=A0ABW3I3P5_9FLAO
MSNFLFNDFDEVSAQAWKQKIQVDLKGADYNETLLWHTNEGITVKPFYHQDQDAKTSVTENNNWDICQYIDVKNSLKANVLAKDALEKGSEAILFKIHSEIHIKELLEGIGNNIPVHFIFTGFFQKTIEEILSLKNNFHFLHLDIIGNLAKTGNWYNSLELDYQFIKEIHSNYPEFNTISVDTSIYQNAGATISQQLAYAMAHANEYFHYFQEQGIKNIQFITATSSNYFFEIAKLKALRILINTLNKVYSTETKCSILSLPSYRNKTIYDYNVNLLRTTTECMSAILGGANTVCNLPYDYIYHNQNEFGDRIARNQLLVLKNESSFDVVQNPADGSYYIETLSIQLAEKALDIFKQIENGGGFLKQLKEGTIQRKIKESAQREQEQFNNGELVLLGTNKYPNNQDRMSHDLEKHPFVEKKIRKTLIEPIIARRLAENSDKERLKTENNQ